MLLYAAVVPPAPVRDWVSAAIAACGGPTGQLELTPPEAMHIPITGFGNLALPEMRRLARVLRATCSGWGTAPTLRFSGATALEWPGDLSVWLKLQGDVEQLTAIARSVPDEVRPLGLLVDRRAFRPWMPVGEITDQTTGPYLERLVAGLDSAESPSWRFDAVSLLRIRWPVAHGQVARLEELERFDLAAA